MKKNKICENEYEKKAWEKGERLIGLDEAGRGPLAGPLIVAGVIFPIGYENEEIYDSKSISEKKRESLFDLIQEEADWFEIRVVSEEDIDRYNIYKADQQAMQKIAEEAPCSIVLTDAMPLEFEDKEVTSIVKGDQKSISIAAASILAKVTRDRLMVEYDEIYPQYGFKKNKGYPTKQHLEAIEEYGITPIHRKSFGPVKASQTKLNLFEE